MYTFPIASIVAGVSNWDCPHERVNGISISTYEKKYQSSEHHGDPIADAYAIIARPNSCILAVADGVNWGTRPRVAARSALYGSIEHLHSKLFQASQYKPLSTQDVFHHILLSFECAQREIIAQEGTTTTLTVAIVIELEPHPRVNSRWGLCVVSVGDSPCFLYKQDSQTVYEVTAAAHMGKGRDPRDSGGCLGANCGDLPDLTNLVCCFVPVQQNDIVFVTSDGVSDNFDLVSLKKAVPVETLPANIYPSYSAADTTTNNELPQVTPEDRQAAMNSSIGRLLGGRSEYLNKELSAEELVHIITTYIIDTTTKKRAFLEDVWERTSDPSLTQREKRDLERKLAQDCKSIPGKLDHSTIVAYQIGELRAVPVTIATDTSPSHRKNTSLHPTVTRRVTPSDSQLYSLPHD